MLSHCDVSNLIELAPEFGSQIDSYSVDVMLSAGKVAVTSFSSLVTRTPLMVTSAAGSQLKRKIMKIGTHNGSFHCDEALGCFLLKQTDAFKSADIIRTRDEDILKDLDVVIDVGGKYDPGKLVCANPHIVSVVISDCFQLLY